MQKGIRPYLEAASRALGLQSQQAGENRRAHVFALLLVAALAIVKYVGGLTDPNAPFTLYAAAVACGAALGGLVPALVATLASLLAGGLVSPPPDAAARLVFLAEGLAVGIVVSALRFRAKASEARVAAAQERIASLKRLDRHGRRLEAALRHLEGEAGETAVAVLNDLGVVTGWRASAERLYGYAAEEVVGRSARSLFFPSLSPVEFSRLLHDTAEMGALRERGTHARRDGSPVEVEVEVQRFQDGDARGFTVAVHDLGRDREWDEYRRAAADAQAALQRAADETRQQLAALEHLTDPSLDPLAGDSAVTELLERLRTTVRADGAALVPRSAAASGVLAAGGLQPLPGRARHEDQPLPPGRVAVVHNDPARVEQLSRLRWPAAATSLLAVPVVYGGRAWSAIEVVNERSRQVSDWDVALVRVVADRLAAVVAEGRGPAARAS